MAAAMITTADIHQWMLDTVPGAQLTTDSRRVRTGDMFLAFPGESGDGRAYIGQAIEAGARAILFDDAGDFQWDDSVMLPHLPVHDLARTAGRIAHEWYGQPDRDMLCIAVTGTNGKTSCTQWLGQALSLQRMSTAVVGTLGIGQWCNGASGIFNATGFTTPDAVQLHRELAEQKKQGAVALAIEASSIGLVQRRMHELHVDVAVLTNFSRDHLDFHGTMGAYEAAKRQLFDWPGLKHAVINLDDAMGQRLLAHVQKNHPTVAVTGYSVEPDQPPTTTKHLNLLSATDIRVSQHSTSFTLHSPAGQGVIRTQLIGRLNVSNVLAIAGVMFSQGMSWQTVVSALESLVAVPGRMQQLGGVDAPLAVIDYAHTPDALEKALQTLRPVAQMRHGELWCVFGCGGDRDAGKRSPMGAAALLADHLIVTSDNPRTEDPADIIAQIIAGAEPAGTKLQVIEDRASAILHAIRHAGKNDVVLVAGKGHEDYQEVKGRRLAFRDADHAALALATRATRNGGH
ncbi:MAG: UDP-N-acetylmuramoyl-L-alanyl-D-glutamate--2,6-diaminopimelate ligase [Betaproteobacteria bacterium]|nr:UDP-N-acetylmuramoyl-L-alanyl-D-glutamate--2,6-diaminopimelate ligase [Betaproteobacteria bacterium]